ncbi:MAG TPA: hypothetical protein VF453_15910 [Burkholderiaceae bacterium]
MRMTRLLLAAALGGAATSLLVRAARRASPSVGVWDPHGDAADENEDGDAIVNRDAAIVADDALAPGASAGERIAEAAGAGSVLRRDDTHADLLASNSREGAFATSSGLSDFTRGA